MKNAVAVMVVMACLLVTGSGFARRVYFEGEGYVTPTEKSLVSDDSGFLANPVARQGRGVVAITPLADAFPDIVLLTTVRDGNGNFVTGLRKNDFVVTEQSTTENSPVTETIIHVNEFQTGAAGSGSGIFSLVFDLSSSMSGERFNDAKAAAISFLRNCSGNDRGSLVSFSSGGTEKIELKTTWLSTDANQNGSSDIIDAVNALQNPSGSTAVYDGIAKGVESLSQEAKPKAVVVFTDGQTNSDESFSLREIISRANNEGVIVYTIGLGVDPQNLRDIANATGGLYFYAPTAQDMRTVYEDIYTEIAGYSQSQYEILYTTHNPAHDGTTRTVTVTEAKSGATGTGLYVVNDKPEIYRDASTIDLSATSQPVGEDLVISGTVTDTDAAALGQTLYANLFYRPQGQSDYTRVPITLQPPDQGNFGFSATIPGASVQEPAVEYYLYAADGNVETYSPFNYGTLPYVIPVLNNLPTGEHTPVSTNTAWTPIQVSARISDPDSGDGISKVILYYRPHNPYQTTAYYPEEMDNADGLNYTCEIPAAKVTNAGIDYFISAWDNNLARADYGSAEDPYFIQVEGGGSPPYWQSACGCESDCESGPCFINGATGLSLKNVLGTAIIIIFCLLPGAVRKLMSRKTHIFRIIAVPILICATVMSARAENKSNALTISPMNGYYRFDTDRNIDDDFIVVLGLGYNITKNIGAEFMAAGGRFVADSFGPPGCDCCDELNGYALHVNGLYHFRPDGRFVPYITSGLGGSILDYDTLDGESAFTANIGGGLKFFITQNIALRADIRHIFEFDGGDRDIAGTVGMTFQWPFGKISPKPPKIPADSEKPDAKPVKPEAKPEIYEKKPVELEKMREVTDPPRAEPEHKLDVPEVDKKEDKPDRDAPAEILDDPLMIRRIQENLTRLGYSPGPVDGKMGIKTETAIKAYQRDMGLPEDGKPTEALLESIRQRP